MLIYMLISKHLLSTELLDATAKSYADLPEATLLEHVFDVKSWITPYLVKLHNHSHLTYFDSNKDHLDRLKCITKTGVILPGNHQDKESNSFGYDH